MKKTRKDYSAFDRPEILQFLFHPRPEYGGSHSQNRFQEIAIPVGEEVVVGARFYPVDKKAPVVLFFHGNGEIVEDYDDLAVLYARSNINFFPVDYRGYGKSSGRPTVSGMMEDSHLVFEYAAKWLADNEYTGPLVVMGRSLGSASALELASNYQNRIDGLVIESGFAFAVPLLRLIGIDTESLGIGENDGFDNHEKIKGFDKPTLVIHAEFDHIIPFSDGQFLFDASPAPEKNLLMIPGANHNSILASGIQEYMNAIQQLVARITALEK
ncbi:MAG: alpha/beta hydrolase [Proteobacteria bacterium]|nr:alpha/beta hydrolase [Pseudomonadota bacterium]